ncbi:metallophosphoesterase [Azospirillum sp.]|uniref:metallophosphoesterase family protein n=1 Tax=Azospirillum sp. TaxID=34012 RepID=UPI0026035323|nr:metallophosphoesterase [Azospirillum sp.]
MDGQGSPVDSAVLASVDPIRILHLTDFHIGAPMSSAQRAAVTELMDAVMQDVRDGVDAVIVTGDIATGGTAAGYAVFKELVIDRMTAALPSRPAFWIVPGNHDHDLSVSLPREEIERRFSQDVDQPGETPLREMLCARLREYRMAFPGPSGPSQDWLLENGVFSDVLRRGDLSIGVVGLNTGWLLDGKSADGGEGALNPGCSLLEGALMRLDHDDIGIRLVLSHHPLSWLAPAAQRGVRAVLEKYRAIYLHGHYHVGDGQFDLKRSGVLIALQARAANITGRRGAVTGGQDARGGYSLLTFTPHAEQFRLLPRIVVGGSLRSDSSAYATDDFALQPETDGSFVFPLPTTGAFIDWLHPFRNNWERYDPASSSAWPDQARWRCYLMGGDADRVLAAALPAGAVMGGARDMAGDALERLTTRTSCAHPCKWAWIEAPHGEGGGTARLQVMHRMSDWVIYRHRSHRPLTGLPLEKLTQDEGRTRRILVVVDNATRHPAEVVRMMQDAALLSAPDRIAFLFGGDPLERAQLPSHYGTAIPFSPQSPAWDHSIRPSLESWMEKVIEAGLKPEAARQAKDLFRDTVMWPVWSWLGGLLAFDKAEVPGWGIDPRWPTFCVEHVRKTLSRQPEALKALTLVAAAHAENKACVTPTVLAQALGMEPMKLHGEILPVLAAEIRRPSRRTSDDTRNGPEAEKVWLTRHRAIAELYTGLIPELQPLHVLIDSVEALWKAGKEPAFGSDWIDLAAKAGRLQTLGQAGDWPRFPASWAIQFGERCRENGNEELIQAGILVLQAALSRDVNRTDCPGLFAMLARLLAQTARSFQEKTDAVLAALAALRDVPSARGTARAATYVVKKGVHGHCYAVLSRLVPEIRQNFAIDDLQNLNPDVLDRIGSDPAKPYATLRSLAQSFSSNQSCLWQRQLAPPSRWLFPNPYRIGE